MNQKRGQVSIFIIIGVVLLIAMLLILFLRDSSVGEASDISSWKSNRDSIQKELLPFRNYVDSCLDSLLEQGLRKVAVSGGTIYPQELGLTFNNNDQTAGDGISMFSGGDMNIRYWSHMKGDNSCNSGCQKVFLIPPLNGDAPGTVQSQVETFIERNIDSCIKNSERILSSGVYSKKQGSPEAEISFNEQDVSVVLNYPFEISSGDKTSIVSEYRSTADVSFATMYENSVYLAVILDQYDLFEKATLSWISLYSDMNSSKLPPKAGTDTSFISTLFWVTEDVKQDLSNILSLMIPMFRVNTAKNFEEMDKFTVTKYYSLYKRLYDDLIIPGSPSFENYDVDFEYLGWKPYLKINEDKEFLQPESFSIDWLPFFGLNRIRTMYSVSYPVKINLHDSEAFNGEGFSMSFATEVNIRDNTVMDENFTEFDYEVFEPQLPETTYMCDPDMRTSKNVSFNLINGKTGKPESGVAMTFVCGDESCPIGMTLEDGAFSGPLPVCSGGMVQLIKPDFETVFLKVSPSIDFEIDLNKGQHGILFEPYRELDLSVKKLMLEKDLILGECDDQNKDWNKGSVQNLESFEKVMVNFKRVKELGGSDLILSEDYSTFTLVEGDTTSEIKLLPGVYDLTLIDIYEDNLVIPKNERCIKIKKFLSSDEECFFVPEEDLIIDKYAGGGAEFNINTRQVVVSRSKLNQASKIELKEVFVDLPSVPEEKRCVEFLEGMGKYKDYSAKYIDELMPEFS